MSNAFARRARRIAACIACVCVAGCAGTGLFGGSPESALRMPPPPLPAPAAMDKVAVGKSTKAEVSAALGPAIVIPFDSGYEVWVYRWGGAERTTRAATELVVLFAPSGLATKVRLRPGYAARE